MRLFIAINFSEPVKDNLVEIMSELKPYVNQGRFTHRENLHLTLVFLGEIAPSRLEQIKQAMDGVTAAPFPLALNGLGRFSRNGGDIYWLGIKPNVELSSIHAQLTKALSSAGFSLEMRDYKPHLTLGREMVLDKRCNSSDFNCERPDITMEVSKVSLMKSERINGKLVYNEIYTKRL